MDAFVFTAAVIAGVFTVMGILTWLITPTDYRHERYEPDDE